jgi:hypothetical protein
MGEERERSPDPGGPSSEEAPPGDPDYHLHTELAEETKRLATHPRKEAHRLAEELREGETETTPLIALSGLVLGLGGLVTKSCLIPSPEAGHAAHPMSSCGAVASRRTVPSSRCSGPL